MSQHFLTRCLPTLWPSFSVKRPDGYLAAFQKGIADFDPAPDCETIKQFCREEGISQETFHILNNRATVKGRASIITDITAA